MSKREPICDPYCIGCQYLCVNTAFGVSNCNYILDTGHMRGCPPGEGCIRKKPIRKGRQTRRNDLTIDRRYRWAGGWNDPKGGTK